MAASIFGGPITVSGSASNLTTLLGLGSQQHFSNLVIRAASGNAGVIWLGKGNLTTTTNQLGYLRAAESIAADLMGAFTSTGELFLVATTPGDIAYVFGIS